MRYPETPAIRINTGETRVSMQPIRGRPEDFLPGLPPYDDILGEKTFRVNENSVIVAPGSIKADRCC